jgi:hypothetical protein
MSGEFESGMIRRCSGRVSDDDWSAVAADLSSRITASTTATSRSTGRGFAEQRQICSSISSIAISGGTAAVVVRDEVIGRRAALPQLLTIREFRPGLEPRLDRRYDRQEIHNDRDEDASTRRYRVMLFTQRGNNSQSQEKYRRSRSESKLSNRRSKEE